MHCFFSFIFVSFGFGFVLFIWKEFLFSDRFQFVFWWIDKNFKHTEIIKPHFIHLTFVFFNVKEDIKSQNNVENLHFKHEKKIVSFNDDDYDDDDVDDDDNRRGKHNTKLFQFTFLFTRKIRVSVSELVCMMYVCITACWLPGCCVVVTLNVTHVLNGSRGWLCCFGRLM